MIRLKHFIRARPRLTASTLTGILCYFVLTQFAPHISVLTRGLFSWNVTMWLYVLAQWWLMMRADPARIRRIALLQDETAATVLTIVSIASVASLLAILFELATAKQLTGTLRVVHLGLTGLTLAGAWLLVPTAFAIHYAHLFYGDRSAEKALLFPNPPAEPSYWDFLYFSFTIGVASQTADVAVGNSRTRRVVLAQSILSFIFNISILGLSINVGASLLG
ncbi:DUF1345 domain-containing protein [Andreprevotia chitinilytica]|uniref:DUF1345 domain-containing protein n=1 Tax=Andreprevotia chitinilytica TaxID=396808 RepID=UPI0005507E1D|nr:DUF1345 domain-containing protein [Andreprevotia chitinilytica]